jgi:hypothetical protein
MSLLESTIELKLSTFNRIYECKLDETDLLLIDTINYFKKRCDISTDTKINSCAESIYTLCGLFIEHRDNDLRDKLSDFIHCTKKDHVSPTLVYEMNCILNVLHASNLLIPYTRG